MSIAEVGRDGERDKPRGRSEKWKNARVGKDGSSFLNPWSVPWSAAQSSAPRSVTSSYLPRRIL